MGKWTVCKLKQCTNMMLYGKLLALTSQHRECFLRSLTAYKFNSLTNKSAVYK